MFSQITIESSYKSFTKLLWVNFTILSNVLQFHLIEQICNILKTKENLWELPSTLYMTIKCYLILLTIRIGIHIWDDIGLSSLVNTPPYWIFITVWWNIDQGFWPTLISVLKPKTILSVFFLSHWLHLNDPFLLSLLSSSI